MADFYQPAKVTANKNHASPSARSFVTGDGAAVSEETALSLTAHGPAQVLVFDLN